ncbi:stellacyanin-like [Panicum miliaceum]|uniref:Stellacyanin-like n=1 Tax=Panicum miliaceum TaxID=4540 RepID=A0A3L6QX68_PANMI|nr:stellacyanin-like [Panicum miliaceum]
MASKSLLIVAVAVLFAAAPALAADLVVWDDKGWALEVDYDEWVDGNQFFVGDRLVFKYTKVNHSVVEATAAGFAACSDANSLATWSSGDDRVPLSGSGQRWFFSGVGSRSSSSPRPRRRRRRRGGSGRAPVLGIAFARVTDDEPLEMYAPWFL